MLEQLLGGVYTKFKMNFYRKIFSRFETREANLTAVETFCVEVIYALDAPTANEFARFVSISQSNATHKIQSLIKKGYVTKSQSPSDKREYVLNVTDRFFRYYDLSSAYLLTVAQRIRETFSKEDLARLERYLDTIYNVLMPEIQLGHPPELTRDI